MSVTEVDPKFMAAGTTAAESADRRDGNGKLDAGSTPAMEIPAPGESAALRPAWIYMNGEMVPYESATIHVSSVAAKYGVNAFEGICAYAAKGGQSFVFRVEEHLQRLKNSVRMMQIDCKFNETDFLDAICSSLHENDIRGDAHIRLTVFVSGEGSCDGKSPASLVCVATPRPSLPLHAKTAHAAISTWRRMDDSIAPPRMKAGANCCNSRFGLLEARRNGYDEAIFLNLAGKISEGANSSFFMVRGDTLITPPVTAAVLEGVTRATLLELASEDLGLRVQEREIDRSELYVADEAFFCGSTQEVRPILSIDQFSIGNCRIGPTTRHLWDGYEAVVRGRNKSRFTWLTPVFENVRG